MTLTELKSALAEAGVSEDAYYLGNSLGLGECYCLARTGSCWETYYSERGEKIGVRHFESEDDACRYFLQKILSDPTTRKKVS